MFNLFKKNKSQNKEIVEIPTSLINDNEIQLNQSELNEIDDLIISIKITINELEMDINEINSDNSFHIQDDDDIDMLPEDKKRMLDIVKKGLNNVMDEFLNQKKQELINKLDHYKVKLNIWESLRSKIDSQLRLTIDSESLSDSALPLNIFINKVMKTIENNPTLLNESQTQKIKDYIDSIMKEALNFNS
jgi:hypothetical protein